MCFCVVFYCPWLRDWKIREIWRERLNFSWSVKQKFLFIYLFNWWKNWKNLLDVSSDTVLLCPIHSWRQLLSLCSSSAAHWSWLEFYPINLTPVFCVPSAGSNLPQTSNISCEMTMTSLWSLRHSLEFNMIETHECLEMLPSFPWLCLMCKGNLNSLTKHQNVSHNSFWRDTAMCKRRVQNAALQRVTKNTTISSSQSSGRNLLEQKHLCPWLGTHSQRRSNQRRVVPLCCPRYAVASPHWVCMEAAVLSPQPLPEQLGRCKSSPMCVCACVCVCVILSCGDVCVCVCVCDPVLWRLVCVRVCACLCVCVLIRRPPTLWSLGLACLYVLHVQWRIRGSIRRAGATRNWGPDFHFAWKFEKKSSCLSFCLRGRGGIFSPAWLWGSRGGGLRACFANFLSLGVDQIRTRVFLP